MSKKKGGTTVSAVWRVAEPIAKELGLDIWDVRFVKEGASWYLRIFIDKSEGVTIEDCENMSRAVDGPLDELDPIEQSYFLEVSSPGTQRELTRPEHYEKMKGNDVVVKLYRPADTGEKEFVAELVGLSGDEIVFKDMDGTKFTIAKKEASSVHLYDDISDYIGGAE